MLTLLGVATWLSKPALPHRTRSGIPLPPSLHSTIPAEDIRGKKLVIIGDVHGCYGELNALLRHTDAQSNESTIVILAGDLVNKGPKSVDVIRLAKSLGNRCYAVRGNHDEAGLREWFRLKTDPSYQLSAKYAWVRHMVESDANYLLSLPYTLTVPSRGILVVHAGLIPGRPIKQNSPADMTTMRNLIVHDHFGYDYAPTDDIRRGVSWGLLWPGPEFVLYGHDARRRLQQYKYATGLDTGCVYGGQLTAMLVEENGTRHLAQIQSCNTTVLKNSGAKKFI